MQQPAIAIVTPNTLTGFGLAAIIKRMMPGADIRMFPRYAELASAAEADSFFHYFVSASEVLAGAAYFLARQAKTIVLVHGNESGHLPQGFHTLNVQLGEQDLVRAIVSLAHRSHHAHGPEPEAVRQARHAKDEELTPAPPRLTPREREVLKEVVGGHINKEIAEHLGVSLATVIRHRKNLTEKLGTRNVAALTIYAVAHGIVRGEDI